jgi:hypothetical protein
MCITLCTTVVHNIVSSYSAFNFDAQYYINCHLFNAFDLEFCHCLSQNAISFRGRRRPTPTRGFAGSEPHWVLCSQTLLYWLAFHALAKFDLPESFS